MDTCVDSPPQLGYPIGPWEAKQGYPIGTWRAKLGYPIGPWSQVPGPGSRAPTLSCKARWRVRGSAAHWILYKKTFKDGKCGAGQTSKCGNFGESNIGKRDALLVCPAPHLAWVRGAPHGKCGAGQTMNASRFPMFAPLNCSRLCSYAALRLPRPAPVRI